MEPSARLAAAALGAALLLAGPALAQAPSGTGRQEQGAAMSGTAGHSGSDVLSAPEFLRLAASNAMFEVESGKLALERSRDERQRSFARKMIEAHEKARQDLRDALGSAGLGGTGMPTGLAEQHRTWMDQLRAAQGAESFQALYAQQQAQAHLMAIDLLRNYAQRGDDEALRRWAAAQLDMLQGHLREAQALR